MALQRTRRPRLRSGRSLRSLGSPLNARPLDASRIAAVGLLLLAAAACAERHRTYVLAAGTQPGQIVIERANPACPGIPPTSTGVEVRIPSSGYICTSSRTYFGWSYTRYVLETPSGRKPLKFGREIFNHATLHYGRPGCEMVGETFYYLPGGVNVQTGADMAKLFSIHHNCDPSIVPTGGV